MEGLVVKTFLDVKMVVKLFQPSFKALLGRIFSLSAGKVGAIQGMRGQAPSLIPAGIWSVWERGDQGCPSLPCWVGMQVAKGPGRAVQTLTAWSCAASLARCFHGLSHARPWQRFGTVASAAHTLWLNSAGVRCWMV